MPPKSWKDYVPRYVSLYYVDYNENLDSREDLQELCIRQNSLHPLEEQVWEWYAEQEHDNLQGYLADIRKAMEADGKADEYAYFLDTYGQPVFSLIVRIVGSEEDAEELTQDTFMKAFRHLSSFNGNSSFSTWIYRIAYNTALSFLRKSKVEQINPDDKLWNTISDTETDNLLDECTSERIELLRDALSRLSPDERALITLFYEDEKTIEEIALITNQREGNVKVKLHRLRKKLANWIKEEEKR